VEESTRLKGTTIFIISTQDWMITKSIEINKPKLTERYARPRSIPATNNLTKEWLNDLSFNVYWLDQHKYIIISSVSTSKTLGLGDYGRYSLLFRLRNHLRILVGSARTNHSIRMAPSHLKGRKISLRLRNRSYLMLDFPPNFYFFPYYHTFAIAQIELAED
jgi:hypothetical protein